MRIELISRRHRALFSAFKNQEPSLEQYLRRYALKHTERQLLARSYLAIDDSAGSERLVGYFSLSAVSVLRSDLNQIDSLSNLPRFPVPGVLLARLAVDEEAQGQGIGRYLFEEALGRTLKLAASGPLGFRLFVTDAINERAICFYQRFGLQPLSDGLPTRMVLDLAKISSS